jgi:membrane protein YqaA with SNARE-associated domain
MRWFSRCIVGLFATPIGVVILAAADSTLLFSLPFGIDATIIVVAARRHELAWIIPLLATGSWLAGAALTFWMGVKIGENGLDLYAPPRRLKKIRCRIRKSGAVLLAVIYGEQLLGWFDSDVFHDIVAVAIVLAVALTLLSMLRFLRATRSPHRRRASA